MKVLFTGGGSGGHLFPIIAIIREIKKNYPEINSLYVGPKDNFSNRILKKEGIEYKNISSGKLRRYLGLKSILLNFIDLFIKIPLGFFQSLKYLHNLRPSLIFSKGGYGSLPIILSARILKIPVFLHESDSIPGLVNKITAKQAKKIFTSFPSELMKDFPKEKIVFTGNPIRKELIQGSQTIGKKIFSLAGGKPLVLILGGSQGAQRINTVIIDILGRVLKSFELIHVCGELSHKDVQDQANLVTEKNAELRKYYHLYGFLDEYKLKHAYAVSNLVISRAGSGFIFEIMANNLPNILVPLPESAQNHQRKNAYICQVLGASKVIEESNFKPNYLLQELQGIFTDSQQLRMMSENTKKLSSVDSAGKISLHIYNYLKTN